MLEVTSYSDVAYLNTDSYRLPIGLNGKLEAVDIINGTWALFLEPNGWSVYYKWWNNGGITGRPWGGGMKAGGSSWYSLNSYIDKFVDASGNAIINILEDDQAYQTMNPPPPECTEGGYWCDGCNLKKCIGGQWVLQEENTPKCGMCGQDEDLPQFNIGMFSFTEVIDNNLPYSVRGWAPALCGPTGSYQNHLNTMGLSVYFEITRCEYGVVGSHGGCSTCAMIDVTCTLKPEFGGSISNIHIESVHAYEPGTANEVTELHYGDIVDIGVRLWNIGPEVSGKSIMVTIDGSLIGYIGTTTIPTIPSGYPATYTLLDYQVTASEGDHSICAEIV